MQKGNKTIKLPMSRSADPCKNSGADALCSPIIQSRPLQPIPIEHRSSGASVWVPNVRSEKRDNRNLQSESTQNERTESHSVRPLEPVTQKHKLKREVDAKSIKLKKSGVVNYNALREAGSSINSFTPVSRSCSSNRSTSILFSQGEMTPYLHSLMSQSPSRSSTILHACPPIDRKPPRLPFEGGVGGSESFGMDNSSYSNSRNAAGSSFIGFMEGPLPSEVREIIRTCCSAEKAEEAEKEARRLLSTSRRLKVFREEIKAAMEELGDAKTECDRHELVAAALREEVLQLAEKIEALQREKAICEEQIIQVQDVGIQRQKKLRQAEERVQLLNNTIDTITRETSMAHLFLRQAVPNLNIENYA